MTEAQKPYPFPADTTPPVVRDPSAKYGGERRPVEIAQHRKLVSPDAIPLELVHCNNWVLWRYGEGGNKIPVNYRTLGNAGVNYPGTWGPFERVLQAYERNKAVSGIGIVLTPETGITVIDIDGCVSQGSAPKPEVAQGLPSFDNRADYLMNLLYSYTEFSASRTGVHVFVRGAYPDNRGRRNNQQQVEMYGWGRWIAITGDIVPGFPLEIEERSDGLTTLHAKFFPSQQENASTQQSLLTAPHSPSPTVRDQENVQDDEAADAALWQRLFRGNNGEFFRQLYEGNISQIKGYKGAKQPDESRGVLMLLNALAFMTDFNAARMERMVRQTGLVRDKFDRKIGNMTWIQYQIQDAIRYTLPQSRKYNKTQKT